MWQDFEARIDENEEDGTQPLHRALWDAIQGSGLRPGNGITKKMLSFEFGLNDRLVWEVAGSAQNIFLSERWRPPLEQAGIASDLRAYHPGARDGGRHSALSREWSFGKADCIVVRIDSVGELRRLLGVILRAD